MSIIEGQLTREPRTEAEMENEMLDMFAEMQQLNARIRADQHVIDSLRAEAAAYVERTHRHKTDGTSLDAEIRSRLDSLRAVAGSC